MEANEARARLPRSFWMLAGLTVTWWALLPGVYLLFERRALWGSLLSAVGVLALVVALSRPILARLEARAVSRPLAMIFVGLAIAMALFEVWFALPLGADSPYPPGAVGFHSALLLLCGVATGTALLQPRGTA